MKKYKMCLHDNTIKYIYNYIKDNKKDIKNILEFGSGLSTKFLLDTRDEFNLMVI